jgi:hypothetical protein
MGAIHSAEIAEASATRERRIKIVNRHTGEKWYRPFRDHTNLSGDMDRALREKVWSVYTSPDLIVSMLWYDKALEMLFFEVTNRR